MSFRFAIPELDAGQTVDVSSRRVGGLIQELSELDTPDAARLLNSFLSSGNRSVVRVEERLRALEALLPTAKTVLRDLSDRYQSSTLPLSGAQRDAATAARTLQLELGYGYKRVLMETTQKLSAEGQRILPFLLCRVMRELSDTLVTAYCTYCPTPSGIWQEIHHIFHYAQFYGLDDSDVDDFGEGRRTTLGGIYREVLLFALMDPYHLQPGEAHTVLELVAHFGHLLVVEPYHEVEHTDGVFLIQASQDKPPRPLAASGGAVISPMDKLLDTGRLVAELGATRRRSEAGEIAELTLIPVAEGRGSLHALLARLERHWTLPPRRTAHRKSSTHPVTVAVGVPRVAGAVAGGRPMASGSGELWQVANESAGGIALRREAGGASEIKVGEVVAISHPEVEGWQPGVVRWVHDRHDAMMECGVQLLAGTCSVLSLQAQDDQQAAPRLGLHLPEMPQLGRPGLLLTSRGTFQPGREWAAEGPNGHAAVRGVRLEDHTYQIELFEFEVVGGSLGS